MGDVHIPLPLIELLEGNLWEAVVAKPLTCLRKQDAVGNEPVAVVLPIVGRLPLPIAPRTEAS